MKVNKIAVLTAMALSAGVAHSIVNKPQPFPTGNEKEIVEYCDLFPKARECQEGTDGAGNGGGTRPPQ